MKVDLIVLVKKDSQKLSVHVYRLILNIMNFYIIIKDSSSECISKFTVSSLCFIMGHED